VSLGVPLCSLGNVVVGKAFLTHFTEGPGCWEWRGHRDRRGYGKFQVVVKGKGLKTVAAHRLASPQAGLAAYNRLEEREITEHLTEQLRGRSDNGTIPNRTGP
jgi:hypothetical protein